MNAVDSFGRDPVALAEPRALGNFIDDTENQIGTWLDDHVKQYANEAYDAAMARFEKDKQKLADEIVVAAKPGMTKAVKEILDDADIQARVGTLQDDLTKKAVMLAAATGIGTAVCTWLLIRYAGGSKR